MLKSLRFYFLGYIGLYILSFIIFVMQSILFMREGISLNLYSPDPEYFPFLLLIIPCAFIFGIYWGRRRNDQRISFEKTYYYFLIGFNLILIYISIAYRSEILETITLFLYDWFGFDPFNEDPKFAQRIIVAGCEMLFDPWFFIQVFILDLGFCCSMIRFNRGWIQSRIK
ncbi:hypothetical protein [Sinanaerobacter sp. ZZT-01]|uniref:hypothetical protein n=1 Tax=Sinanaerobacter sp. ZZT-01 TaxID=3111540 RepID=UPI002D7877BD|nr:hypothetical protein [Sinanaerobacter sp. ZZT-01]WRR94547.1 hypothetical protein U5921_05370 [Sinanaerobacter sp. ZZT-01]